jgi:polyhydroxyalkanoate synthesis regulator phasin
MSQAANPRPMENSTASATTKKNWLADSWPKLTPLASAIATVAMTSIGFYLLYIWHVPDVRYEPGAYYRSGDIAIASLKLQNYGMVDAEDISIEASFPEVIERDVTTSGEVTPFLVKSGGKGNKTVVGTVARLVPDQSVTVYYAIHNPEGPIPSAANQFVGQIFYKGGKARLGLPWGWATWVLFATNVVFIGYSVFSMLFNIRAARRRRDELEALLERYKADGLVKAEQHKESVKALIKEYKAEGHAKAEQERREVEALLEKNRLMAQEVIAKASAREAIQALAEEIAAAFRAPRPRKRSNQSAAMTQIAANQQQTTDPSLPVS